jgi:phage FluMu protein Com
MKLLGQCTKCGMHLCEKDMVGIFTSRCPACGWLHDEKSIKEKAIQSEEARKERAGVYYWKGQS